MATCKENCLHYEACKAIYEELTGDNGTGGNAEYCKFFEDRSKIIEQPCKVGDTVYIPQRKRVSIYESIANALINFVQRLKENKENEN